MVASIADARVGTVLRGLSYKPRYYKTIKPIIIGGMASGVYRYSDNSNQNNVTHNTMATTPAVQTNNNHTICTNEDSANTHDSMYVDTANTTESGFSVWLYVLFGMMALAVIVFIYLLFDGSIEKAPSVSHQAFVATKPSPRTIELANNGGIMIL